MRSDDMAKNKVRGDGLTADELLLLLNQTVGEKREETKKPLDTAPKAAPKALAIDDAVYESAEKELRNSDAVRATDDSDLDLDQLIEKFINEPKRERALAAQREKMPLTDEYGNEIVKELSLPYADSFEEEDSAEEETASEKPENISFEINTSLEAERPANREERIRTTDEALRKLIEASASRDASDFDEPKPIVEDEITVADEAPMHTAVEETVDGEAAVADDEAAEITVADTGLAVLTTPDEGYLTFDENNGINAVPVAEETVDAENSAFDEDADDDVKIADGFPAFKADDDNNVDDAVADDGEKTAVFDISLVKELIDDAASADGDAESSQTEIFGIVKPDETADGPEKNAPEETAVYGDDEDGEPIDQADLALMVALGMDDELVDKVGKDQKTAIEDDILRGHDENVQAQNEVQKREFTSFDQVKDILVDFKNRYYLVMVRIVAAIILLGIMFVYENHGMLGLSMPDFARPSSYPVVYAMLDLQLVVLCGALVGRQIIDGVVGIVKLKPIPECLTAFAFVISVLYTVAVCFVAPVGGFELYNMPVALAAVIALVYEFLNLRRDIFSFNVVSSTRKKFVISPVSDETETVEREAFDEYIPEEAEIVRVGKTDFVDGFFSRTEETRVTKPIVGIVLPIVLLLAVIFTVLTFVKTRSAYDSISMAYMTAAMTLPLTAFIIYSFPFYRASKTAYSNNSTIVGEYSLTEYSNSAVISFEDKEVFPAAGVKVTSVKVYGNNRIDEIIYKFASAFMKVGGPLADVFKMAIRDIGHSENVELLEVDDDGITVSVDDVQVYIGKSTYMEKKDYDPPYDHEGRIREQEGTVSVLYIAYGGSLAAKLYVSYTIDGEFEKIMSQLYKTGLCVGIKSFDPNIDDLLLSKKIRTTKYPVKVIRSKNVEEIPHTFERCDSGIVSERSVKSLLRTVALCERVGSVVKTGLFISALSMLIGVVVMAFIFAFGDAVTFTSLYIVLYQMIWAVLVSLFSKFLI